MASGSTDQLQERGQGARGGPGHPLSTDQLPLQQGTASRHPVAAAVQKQLHREPQILLQVLWCVWCDRTSGQNIWLGFGTELGPEPSPMSWCRPRAGVPGTDTGVNGEGWGAWDADSGASQAQRHSSNKLNSEYLKMTLVYCPDQVSGKNIGRLNKETGCFSR